MTTPPAWLSDWTKTELTFRNSNDVQFVVYAREVQQGERVTLGENGQSSGCVNYTVMAVKKAEEQALTGDIDDNGVLGVTDAVMLQKWLLRAGTLTNGKNADINGDGIINVIDLTLLKRMLTA